MNRSIPFVLSLALFAPAALAEDQAQPGQAGAAAQPDQPAAAEDQAGAAQDPSAAGADDQAQPAAAQQEGQQDPTQLFIKDQYSTNLFEIQLGEWVQQRAKDQKVKQLAEMLVKDHTQANQQLKEIAQSAGVQIEEKLDPVHQAKLQKFQQCAPSEIDRKFAFSQAAGHMMSVLELTYQSKNAQNEKVKQYATESLPKMKHHLDQATEIATTLAGGSATGEAQPASARQPGDPATDQPSDDAAPPKNPGASDQPSDQDPSGTSGESGTPGQPDPSGATDQPGQPQPQQ